MGESWQNSRAQVKSNYEQCTLSDYGKSNYRRCGYSNGERQGGNKMSLCDNLKSKSHGFPI